MLHFALCMSMFVCLEIKIFVFVFVLLLATDNKFIENIFASINTQAKGSCEIFFNLGLQKWE